MIRTVLLACLLQVPAGAQTPSALTVRKGTDTVGVVSVLVTQRGPVVRLEQALSAVGAVLIQQSSDRMQLVIGGVTLDLTLGLPVVVVRGQSHQLPAAPTRFDGNVLVPLALFADVLPRVASAYRYDAARAELIRDVPGSVVAESTPRRVVPPVVPRAKPKEQHVVVVDAGHGGPDRGMSGPIGSRTKVFEADITLAVARALQRALEAKGIRVVMTRTRDTLIALADRASIANRAQADLFLSVHVNAANPRWTNPRGARGFETYFLSEAKTEDERRVEAMENEAVKYETPTAVPSNEPLSFILTDMKQNENLRESSALAEAVQGALAEVHPGPNRGVKQAGFRVLLNAFMPAVLVEIGFGTNVSEAGYISGRDGQRQIAGNIADAVERYLSSLDRRITGAAEVRR